MLDRQTLLSEHSEQGERPTGPKFDRAKVLRLLYEDRTTIGRAGEREGIRVYLEGYTGYLRGKLYSCLEDRGHPVIADVFRGLPQDEFLEEVADRRAYIGTVVPSCLEYTARIETEKERIKRIDDLVETSYTQGEELTDYELIVHASDLLDEEIEFLDDLEEVLRDRGTVGSIRRADEVKKAKERAKDKKEQIDDMFAPAKKLVRGKIRIYNQAFTPAEGEEESPKGKFQCFYETDMLADYDGRVQDWWLTRKEIEVCKQAFIQYWWLKGGEETKAGRDMEYYSDKAQSVLEDYPSRPEKTPEGVAGQTQDATRGEKIQSRYWGSGASRAPAPVASPAMSKEELAEQISGRLNKPVKRLDIEDLVVGMSSDELTEIDKPQGVVQTRAMVIDVDTGEIDFIDTRSYKWTWNTEEEDLETARKELEKEGII